MVRKHLSRFRNISKICNAGIPFFCHLWTSVKSKLKLTASCDRASCATTQLTINRLRSALLLRASPRTLCSIKPSLLGSVPYLPHLHWQGNGTRLCKVGAVDSKVSVGFYLSDPGSDKHIWTEGAHLPQIWKGNVALVE